MTLKQTIQDMYEQQHPSPEEHKRQVIFGPYSYKAKLGEVLGGVWVTQDGLWFVPDWQRCQHNFMWRRYEPIHVEPDTLTWVDPIEAKDCQRVSIRINQDGSFTFSSMLTRFTYEDRATFVQQAAYWIYQNYAHFGFPLIEYNQAFFAWHESMLYHDVMETLDELIQELRR